MWPDESADNAKSSWPVQVGLYICYNEDINDRGLLRAANKCFPSTDRLLQFEARKDGIASNRK